MNQPSWIRQYLIPFVTILIAVFGGTGVALVVTDDDPSTPDITVAKLPLPHVQAQAPANVQPDDGHPTETVKADPQLVQQLAPAVEKSLRQDAPTSDSVQERVAPLEKTVKELPTGGAVQGFEGCRTRILPVNWSSRNGARALEQVDHYTVSYNVPGWSDVNAIWNLFANSARQASSNFIIDAEGNCYYAVPIEGKAWTQAGGNPWSISYEVVAYGNESAYLQPAGWTKLRSVQRQVAKRTGIPLRRGAIGSNCVPVVSGIVQHKDFGLCGGGHVDITPFSIAEAVERVAGKAPVLSPKERKLVASARRPKGTGHTHRYWCGRVSGQLFWLNHSLKVARHDGRVRILRRVYRRTCS